MMPLRRLFSVTFAFYLVLAGFHFYLGDEVQEIDVQIEQLEEMKRGYEARALRHDYYAEYLQFNDQAYLETRRHMQLADENRAKAALIQQKIDALQAKKKKLQR